MRKNDLLGKRFGKLVVIKNSKSHFDGKRTRTVWKCKCDCGNFSLHRTEDLKTGDSTSCGCFRKQYREIDLVNMRFNNLLVLKKIKSGKSSEVYWLCRCDCGTECEIFSSYLRNGWKKSCGCIKDTEEESLLIDFFWKNVKKGVGCWEWSGMLCKGYGTVDFHGQKISSHRLSYMIHKGKIEKNKLVCHTCDNKKCVNPDHLYSGTNEDNLRDAKERDLIHRGEKCTNSKLKETEVFKILTSKEIPLNIATQYNISIGHVGKILRRKVWGHVIIP